MREAPARQALVRRVSEVEASLEASWAQGATDAELARLDALLQSLDRLLRRFPPRRNPPWLLPLSVAVIAVSLIGIAASVRLSGPALTVDARLSALAITAASQGTGLSSDEVVPVRSLEVAGDAMAQAIASQALSVSSVRVTAGTTALLEQRASCLEVRIPAEQGPVQAVAGLGLDLVVLHAPKAQGQLPTPAEIRVSPGKTLTICGDFPGNYALAGRVGRIELFRRQPGAAQQGFEDLRTPSIVSGKLRLPAVGRVSDLQDTDMVLLDRIEGGWAFVFPATAMRLVFSGTVDRPLGVTPAAGTGSVSLQPTLLEWLTKSPLVTAAFGLVTGLVGMLWGFAKYLGLSSR